MRALIVRTLAALSVMLLFLPFSASPDNGAWANPFQMRILDQDTGEGLSHVRVISDSGLVCYTRADGSVLWTETSLMNRDVSFRIDAPGAQRTVKVRVMPGGHAEVAIPR
jgi:hypothetical protein